MFNKERFHNTLALSLGYERIVKDKRISIEVDDSDDPWMTLKYLDCSELVKFKASEINDTIASQAKPEIRAIIEAAHQAYMEANKPF